MKFVIMVLVIVLENLLNVECSFCNFELSIFFGRNGELVYGDFLVKRELVC